MKSNLKSEHIYWLQLIPSSPTTQKKRKEETKVTICLVMEHCFCLNILVSSTNIKLGQA